MGSSILKESKDIEVLPCQPVQKLWETHRSTQTIKIFLTKKKKKPWTYFREEKPHRRYYILFKKYILKETQKRFI